MTRNALDYARRVRLRMAGESVQMRISVGLPCPPSSMDVVCAPLGGPSRRRDSGAGEGIPDDVVGIWIRRRQNPPADLQ